jgi:hypothetical protein
MLNIIDIFSFNDEYNKYFVEKNRFHDENIRELEKCKNENKNIRKKID